MACDTIKIETLDADEVVSIVTAGPQGPSGAEAATLTTTGDLLYRAALANDRLPIGSEGQVLKVSGGLPAWGNESGAVTSVNGATGAVTLDATDVGAVSLFEYEAVTITSATTLNAARAKRYTCATSNNIAYAITLPTTGNQNGDLIEIFCLTSSGTISIQGLGVSLAQAGQQLTFRYRSDIISWSLVAVDYHTQPANTITGLGSAATASTSDFAAASHTHPASDITSGTLTHERGGLEADVSAYNGLLKIASGSTSAVTVTAAGEALLDDATNADQRTTLGLGTAAVANLGTGASDAAYGNHTHTQLHDKSHTMTDATSHTAGNHKVFYSDGSGNVQELSLGNSGEVLTSNGATSAPSFAAASGGDTVSIEASAGDVLSVSSGAISADDGGTIDSADPFIKWDDVAGKLVYANPLSRPSGAFYVGLAPTTTALGTDAVNIQPNRSAATRVSSGLEAIAIGNSAIASNVYGIAIGRNASSTGGGGSMVVGPDASCAGNASITLGYNSSCAGNDSMTLGNGSSCAGNTGTVVGRGASCSQSGGVSIGYTTNTTAVNATGIGNDADASLRGQFMTRPFGAIYYGGQTTNDTPLILNLDATATNRFTIAASTALAVDILLVARRSDTQDKWLVARRFLGIRRDGSNNTSLIGSVQTLGTDQSDGSPSWTFALTADDTNEALQLEVTGAASETVQWRATAFYRVV